MSKHARGGLLLAVGLILLSLAFPRDAQAEGVTPSRVKVMTFNVLCSFCKPKEYGPWTERLTYFADLFARHDPDLLGIQELAKPEEVGQIEKLLPNHEAVFFKKGKLTYPDATIFYRRDRFELIESGVYWLSRDPERPMSMGWLKGLQVPRCVVWAQFRQIKDRRPLFFVTTHFDANNPNQEHSAPILMERTAQRASDVPILVTGDFNSRPESKAYQILTTPLADGFQLKNTYDLAREKRTVCNQNPAPQYDPASRIDHIFVGGKAEWKVLTWTVDLTVYGEPARYPSDHRAMVADVVF
ncbi:MAG: endonuclease/exonuclease/phosphatase family protein [Phycisphaerae bacterium]|nr:endonuclease/exonuclease/phosphatase family protein [Phycisphaerae bacterium]